MEPVATAKKIRLNSHIQPGVLVRGDLNWMEHAILNLLDNAIKCTDGDGEVNVTLSAQNGDAVLRVQDTGAGISTETLPHVFDRFYRVDAARSREDGGAGLGLSIVRSICSAHGAEIEVNSATGSGSCFRLKFPLSARALVAGVAAAN